MAIASYRGLVGPPPDLPLSHTTEASRRTGAGATLPYKVERSISRHLAVKSVVKVDDTGADPCRPTAWARVNQAAGLDMTGRPMAFIFRRPQPRRVATWSAILLILPRPSYPDLALRGTMLPVICGEGVFRPGHVPVSAGVASLTLSRLLMLQIKALAYRSACPMQEQEHTELDPEHRQPNTTTRPHGLRLLGRRKLHACATTWQLGLTCRAPDCRPGGASEPRDCKKNPQRGERMLKMCVKAWAGECQNFPALTAKTGRAWCVLRAPNSLRGLDTPHGSMEGD